jgi:hypothetical protein
MEAYSGTSGRAKLLNFQQFVGLDEVRARLDGKSDTDPVRELEMRQKAHR